ncbi:MAG: type III-A CRISPR-associated RAMP protein Csm4 [Anaerolineae bacterium]
MPELTVYRLTFAGGLHVGARGVDLAESSVSVPSDTLLAALLDAHCRAGGQIENWFIPPAEPDASTRDCAYRITSAFPYAGEVYFFPMPVPAQVFFSNSLLQDRRKDVKRIRFVSEGILRKMLAGKLLDDWLFPKDEKAEPTTGVALQGGALWLTLAECERLPDVLRHDAKTNKPIPPRALRRHAVYAETTVPRVTVNRINSAANIFHAGRVTFAAGCGLWFGLSGQPPADLTRALQMLSEDGLGGERAAGYGVFSWSVAPQPLALPDPSPNGAALLLSRYHPRAGEIAALQRPGAAYELTAVAGWLRTWDGAAQRRRRLRLLREGSVVYLPGSGPWGDVVDVRPTYENPADDLPHPVWRAGLALAVGWPYSSQGGQDA